MGTMGTIELLSYEDKILRELSSEDGLLIVARGLGLTRILTTALQPFCTASNLVLVLNTSAQEERYMIDELKALRVAHLPRAVTNEVSTAERDVIYYKGGVLFVTSRILVVDMLRKRLPFNLVTGIIVHRAHKLAESSQEGFILRLFRQENRTGFIKGLSDLPTAFMSGYSRVERVMKGLFVRNLYLYPRFHEEVNTCLKQNLLEVEELRVGMTEDMTSIQLSILDILDSCLKDLRRANPALDPEEVTVENCLTDGFHKTLRQSLEPDWYKLSGKSKQLVSDVKILRTILSYLTQYDCITFNKFLNSLRQQDSTNDKSLWMFSDSANSLFVAAQRRNNCSKPKTSSKPTDSEHNKFEVTPKWSALIDILKEIEETNKKNDSSIPGRVLVCASDERTCFQLRRVLCDGPECTLQSISEQIATTAETAKSTNHKANTATYANRNSHIAACDDEAEDEFRILPYDSIVVIHPLRGAADPYDLLRKLYELEPTYVVLYDVDMSFVRQLEVFATSRPTASLRVYFVFYTNSVEEQRYLTTLRKEKQAFEVLIRQKAGMVIPEERQGNTDAAVELLRNKPNESTPAPVSTRKAGGQPVEVSSSQPKIIVDMREFRSELPSLIHRASIDIEPVTLEVGDYILSLDMCVERKSVPDLISSLNSGRLYKQAQSMTRHYKHAILLIEFERSRSFALQEKSALGDEISMRDVSTKLSLLTIHFPMLRVIWSQSPANTVQIFAELKANRSEPDSTVAAAIGVENNDKSSDTIYSLGPQDFLKKLPGIDSKNYTMIMNKVENISELLQKSEQELADVLGNKSTAKTLHNFIHEKSQ